MYYRFYRRRHSIYLAVAVVFILFVLFNRSDNDDIHDDTAKKSGRFGKRDSDGEKKQRITMETYKIPPPCSGCPGENGSPVHLSVIYDKFIFRFYR